MTKKIYLDNSATTRISDVALKKYVEVSEECFGNPSSLHTLGHEAELILKGARECVLSSLSARGTVVFTSSGSEANNLAILGRAYAKERYKRGAKIITTDSEHASVSEPIKKLAAEGFKVAYIPTKGGVLDLDALARELTADTVLVTLMAVNNETGAAYDIKGAAALIKARCPEALLHVDATQSYLKIPTSQRALSADMITISSHKIHGPKGVGALFVSDAVIKSRGLSPIVFGGGQEGGLRSGTENVPAIAAFAEAIREGVKNLTENAAKMDGLRSYLIERLTEDEAFAEISITLPERHAPHILNITLPKIKSETMLHFLSSMGIFVSSGSACSSNSSHKSSALIAYGRSESEADTSVRISLSHENEKEDIDALLDALGAGLSKLARMR